MVSQNVRRSATCIFIGFACALAAVCALILLDVVKVGGSSSGKSGPHKEASARGPGAVNQTTAGVRKNTAQHTAVRATGAKNGGHSTRKLHKTRGTPATVLNRRSTPEESGTEGDTEEASSVAEQTESSRESVDRNFSPDGEEGDSTADDHTSPTTDSQHEEHSSIDRRQMTTGSHGEGVNSTTAQPAEASTERGGKSTTSRAEPSKRSGPEMLSDTDEETTTTEGGRPMSSTPMPSGAADDSSTLAAATEEDESTGSPPGEETVEGMKGAATQNETLSAVVEEPSSPMPGAAALAGASSPPSASAYNGDESVERPLPEGRLGGDIGGPNRLLCTVGSRATAEEMLPPDGLCDRLFYTDVIWRGMAIRGSQNQESWNSFQEVARNSTKTGHGFSVDYGQADRFFANMLTPTGERKLGEVFQGKIVHYGILKATGRVPQLLEDMHGKLGVLRLLKQLQAQFAQKSPEARENLDIVLGIKFQSYKNHIDGRQHSSAMTALANHLPVTIFIVHTHIQEWKNGRYPIIGTVWYYWNDIANTPNEPSLRRTAKELKDAAIPVRTYVMPSFTMMVGEFQQKENATEKGSNSTYMEAKEFKQLCKSRASVAVVNAGIVKLSAADYNRTYTYEDVDTMSAKARAFFNLYRHPHQGWAVFDTEYEDYDNTCGKGTFNRLKAFKAALNVTVSLPVHTNKR